MRRRSPEERRAIVAEFRGSGLTQEAFARRRRISVGTLRSWIYRDDEVEEQHEDRFVEISGTAVVAGPEYLAELARELSC